MFTLARGIALLFGGLTLANLLARPWQGSHNANLWWIDLRNLGAAGDGLLLVGGSLMIAWALRPRGAAWRRWSTTIFTTALATAAMVNASVFYLLAARGQITSAVPLPMSLLIAASLMLIAWQAWHAAQRFTPAPTLQRATWRGMGIVAVAVVGLGVIPLLQMTLFGKTDYRRAADAVVVFGAGVLPDGRPSDALRDRVRTACELYHTGHAPLLIMSGGPGRGSVHETEAMRDLAMRLGVPADAILMDEHGVSTRATVANTLPIFEQHGMERVLAVSHFYHLPRVKMTYQQAGVEVHTVPAREEYTLSMLPWYMLRETAALGYYYLKPT